MPRTVWIESDDDAPCNWRCVGRAGHYCAHYGHCAAAFVHRLIDALTPGAEPRTVVRVATAKSGEGGYCTNRLVEDPHSGETVEEVELHCESLQFDALQAVATGAVPRAARDGTRRA